MEESLKSGLPRTLDGHVKSFRAMRRAGLAACGTQPYAGSRDCPNKHSIPLQINIHTTSNMGPKRKSAPPTPESVLEQLQQSKSLKLLAIAETLSPKDLPQAEKKRNSAASEDSEQNGDTHPAALESRAQGAQVGSS